MLLEGGGRAVNISEIGPQGQPGGGTLLVVWLSRVGCGEGGVRMGVRQVVELALPSNQNHSLPFHCACLQQDCAKDVVTGYF